MPTKKTSDYGYDYGDDDYNDDSEEENEKIEEQRPWTFESLPPEVQKRLYEDAKRQLEQKNIIVEEPWISQKMEELLEKNLTKYQRTPTSPQNLSEPLRDGDKMEISSAPVKKPKAKKKVTFDEENLQLNLNDPYKAERVKQRQEEAARLAEVKAARLKEEEVARQQNQQLSDLKQSIAKVLDEYFNQGTLFSRKHANRVRAVREAIVNAKSPDIVDRILNNQIAVYKEDQLHDPGLGLISRFTTSIKNRPQEGQPKGVYFHLLERAQKLYQNAYKNELRQEIEPPSFKH